ncbi:hypothetical protein [Polyangium sp. 6x1]|uniref:hypothetical protein n=1 Tax=Polyangium sp. 6x1 TaxID=3042689 RepID=UPI00248285F0|nr:hypothetical protein [Polyangium sp. 6x1]MDI1448505.1 hypothetical protein [Polyangium sp. 6x1]
MKSRLLPAFVLAGVFVLGGVAGAGAMRAYMLQDLRSRFGGPPGEVRTHLRVESMRRHLDLTADQVTKVEAIFRETDDELERTMKPCRDGLETLRKSTDDRIVEVLDASQRVRFQEFNDKRKRRPHGGFPPPPGPPPGPPPE